MKKSNQSKNNFIERFIREEKYLQNPPLKTKEFIEFCKKRGIVTNEEELEFFEREKLLLPIIRIDRPIGKDGNGRYYSSYGFNEGSLNLLLELLTEGYLFDPATKPFENWENFIGEELKHDKQKVVSFYSSFQIYWVEILKRAFSLNINFAGKSIKISSSNGGIFSGSFEINDIEHFATELKKVATEKSFQDFFDFDKKKGNLKQEYKEFNILLKLLLSTQSIYYPYFRSGARTVHFTIGDEKWEQIRSGFDLKKN